MTVWTGKDAGETAMYERNVSGVIHGKPQFLHTTRGEALVFINVSGQDVLLCGKAAGDVGHAVTDGQQIDVAGVFKHIRFTDETGKKHSFIGIISDKAELHVEKKVQSEINADAGFER
ncbi:MAG: hypothetical protein J6Y93_05120 [Treponema sp.]|nr:hypothetical protein [Treponema sp.]